MSQPKHILLLKTSSLGDLIHTFPGLSDLQASDSNIRIHWVVEEGLQSVPKWHPSVERVIPVAIRRWRKHPLQTYRSGEWQHFVKDLNAVKYDAVIDAQGLLKSALLIRALKGRKHIPIMGYDKNSIREPLASRFYNQTFSVSKQQHAVERIRMLFSSAFELDKPEHVGEFNLVKPLKPSMLGTQAYAVFLHGTTWDNKHWPETYWFSLAQKVSEQGIAVKLLWNSDVEHERAKRISSASPLIEVLPRMDLDRVSAVIAHASFAVAVDTGLCHLAAAFDVPTVALYGPTDPGLTGSYGRSQIHLSSKLSCAPCLKRQCVNPDILSNDSVVASDIFPPCFVESDFQRVLKHLQQQGVMS